MQGAFAQHDHHNLSDRKKKAAMLVSTIMLLLDDANGNIDLCAPSGDANLPVLSKNTPNEHTDAEKMVEHMAIFEFVDYSKATHGAINSGRWDSPSTWYNNRVPSDCANVIIPEGVTVQLDSVLETRINSVRVDGTLEFSTTNSSKMMLTP